MAERRELEISRAYLDLADECFSKAARTEHAEAAAQLRRMGRHYMSQAAALDEAPRVGGATASGDRPSRQD
jgi:hypothetical protein